MSRAAPIVLALAVAACGRFGFEDHARDADAGAAIDASSARDAVHDAGPGSAPFDPQAGGCLDADDGPFVTVASLAAGSGSGYGVWGVAPRLLAADTDGGLRALHFDGSTLVDVGGLDLGWVEDVAPISATEFFVSSPGTGLYYLGLAPDGVPSVAILGPAMLAQARRGGGSATRFYVADGDTGLAVVGFDGNTAEVLEAPLASNGWGEAARPLGDGRVLFADETALRLVRDDGSALADIAAPGSAHAGTNRVWSDGHTAFAADADGVTAYALGSDSLTELATYPTAAPVRDVWGDGQHIFAADESGTLTAVRFDGGAFSIGQTTQLGGLGLGVYGDGTYLYANSTSSGVHAFTGFACRSW